MAIILDIIGAVEAKPQRLDPARPGIERAKGRHGEQTARRLARDIEDDGLERPRHMIRDGVEKLIENLLAAFGADHDSRHRRREDQERDQRQHPRISKMAREHPALIIDKALADRIEERPGRPPQPAPWAHGKSGAAISPAVSSWPSIRFAFCTAWPDEPLVRLSSAEITIVRPSTRSATTPIWQKFEPRTWRVAGASPKGRVMMKGSSR